MKPILLGMNNPHSVDPANALSTEPVNASGYRLWQMISITGMMKEPPIVVNKENYESGFDRYNLFNELSFDPTKMTPEHRSKVLARLNDRVVVMCGTSVPRVLGMRYYGGFDLRPHSSPDFLEPGITSFVYYVIPHPSGLCREYNDPEMRSRVGKLLLALYILGAVQW